MCSDSIFILLKELQVAVFYFYARQFFLFPPFLNLGVQIRCPQNWYINLKLPLDKPLVFKLLLAGENEAGLQDLVDLFMYLYNTKTKIGYKTPWKEDFGFQI